MNLGAQYIFPDSALPHTRFGVKHIFMMAAMRRAVADFPDLRVLEVGSWLGASTLLWADCLKKYGAGKGAAIHCVDSWKPILSSLDLENSYYRRFADLAENDIAYNLFLNNIAVGSARIGVEITHKRGRSDELLPIMADKSYDFVYVDAGHYYDDVKLDLIEAKRIVSDRGFVCGDDLNLLIGEIDVPAAMAASCRDVVTDPATGRAFHPGVTLAVGEEIDSSFNAFGFWFARNRGDGIFVAETLTAGELFTPSFLKPEDAAFFTDAVLEWLQGNRNSGAG